MIKTMLTASISATAPGASRIVAATMAEASAAQALGPPSST